MQRDQRLDVAGLREHVERLHRAEAVAAFGEKREIARERRRIAREVPQIRYPRAGDGSQRCLIATLARRIQEDDVGRCERVLSLVVDDFAFDAAANETDAIADTVAMRVRTRLGNRGGILLDSDHARTARAEEDREGSRSAVEVDDRPSFGHTGRQEAKDSADHFAVDLEERGRRHAIADALDRLLHVALTPHVGHLATQDRVDGSRFERVRDADDAWDRGGDLRRRRRNRRRTVRRRQRDDRFT